MIDIFPENVTLCEVEEYMISLTDKITIAWAHLAFSLAIIKIDALYLSVAKNWSEYIKQERCGLNYRQSLKLAKAGEAFLRYQAEFESEGIKLSDNLTKMSLVNYEVADNIPAYFQDFKSLSSRKLKDYQQEKLGMIRAYPANHSGENVSVKGVSLYIGEEKVKGINTKEIAKQMTKGKRPLIVYIDDDANEIRRCKRRLKSLFDS